MKLKQLINSDPIEAYETIMDIIKTEGDWDEFLDYCLGDDDIQNMYIERGLKDYNMFDNPTITQEIWLNDMWEQSKDVI